MKKTIALILTAVMLLAVLSGCGGADSGNSAGMANPMTEAASVEILNEAVGCSIKSMEGNYVCDDISDESFFIIKGEPVIAQYSFKLAGIPVTVRAAVTNGDISGIYMEDGTMPHEKLKEDTRYEPIDTGCGIWTRWFLGGMQYSLLVGDGKDYTMAVSKAGYGNLIDIIRNLRDYLSYDYPWYMEPYYTFEDFGEWDDPEAGWDYVDTDTPIPFDGIFETHERLAAMNKDFGESFGTGTGRPFSGLDGYAPSKHKHQVTVSNVDELLAAIAPDTEITLEPGEYLISAAENYGGNGGKYYSWEESYDGWQLVIDSVDHLAITGTVSQKDGGFSPDSFIRTDSRYARVIEFRCCKDIELGGLVIGHTEGLEGFCTGSVLGISTCENTFITGCELYGCGTYGIEAVNSSIINGTDIVIRSCSYGHVNMNCCSGIKFDNSSFFSSYGYGGNCYYSCSDVNYVNCDFAYNRLSELFYADDTDVVNLVNCFIVDNDLTAGIFGNNGYYNVEGGACVEPIDEPGVWHEIAFG